MCRLVTEVKVKVKLVCPEWGGPLRAQAHWKTQKEKSEGKRSEKYMVPHTFDARTALRVDHHINDHT